MPAVAAHGIPTRGGNRPALYRAGEGTNRVRESEPVHPSVDVLPILAHLAPMTASEWADSGVRLCYTARGASSGLARAADHPPGTLQVADVHAERTQYPADALPDRRG